MTMMDVFNMWSFFDLIEPKDVKMTREEAKRKMMTIFKSGPERNIDDFIDGLEALGLLKFDEPKNMVKKLCSVIQEGKFTIKVEECPEGIVVWHDGQIVYRSWKP